MKKRTKVILLTLSIVILSILLTIELNDRSFEMREDWMDNESTTGGSRRMMNGGYRWGLPNSNLPSENYSLESVESTIEAYLHDENLSDEFYISEIMLFDNHAYVQLNEQETDIGAMELLVDAVTMVTYPEQGPNMMWNLKYSHMGGMMNGFRDANWNGNPTQISITVEQAVQLAQEHLIRVEKDWFIEDHAETFYGYYTLHVVDSDGEIIGMLSVNGIDGDVFIHTWHGEFLDMIEMHGSNESH